MKITVNRNLRHIEYDKKNEKEIKTILRKYKMDKDGNPKLDKDGKYIKEVHDINPADGKMYVRKKWAEAV